MSWRAKPRTHTLIAAAVAGAFVLPTGAAAAQPDPKPAATPMKSKAGEEPVIMGRVGLTKDTLEGLRAKGKEARAKGLKSLPASGTPTLTNNTKRSGPGEEPLSLTQGAELSRKGAAANAVDPAPAKAEAPSAAADNDPNNNQGYVPIGSQPHAKRLKACFSDPKVNRNKGRIYNRFTYCGRHRIGIEYWELDSKGNPVELEGTTYATIKVFGQGDAKDRRTRIFSTIEKDSVDYDWGWFDNLWTAPGVSMTLTGKCDQGYTVCSRGPGGYTTPWATWDNNPRWVHWDIANLERSGTGRDKLSYNQWHVEASTDEPGGRKTLNPAETPSRVQRCDSAGYMKHGRNQYPKACVFSEVTPFLTYTLGSDHDGVARHLRDAYKSPNNTYPLPVGTHTKKFPGQYKPSDPDAPGLHRITEDMHRSIYRDNRRHKDGACYHKGRYKKLYEKTGLPNPPADNEDCDEYPFAATLEGAASKKWDFSVRPVDSTENQIAGAKLRAYTTDDRILAWDKTLSESENDRYYVRIK